MWFKNNKTGLSWDVYNTELIDRLKGDSDYEVIELEVQEIDYAHLSYNELKTVAKEKGVNAYGLKKDELLEALEKVGE